jgi:hypothetical protein
MAINGQVEGEEVIGKTKVALFKFVALVGRAG